jgi:uncharacterized membrane protein YphA (DoxX/SURF4 family)
MNTFLWILQIVLAVAFVAAGFLKLTQSRDQLKARGLDWVEDFSANTVKLIGVAELLGAIGLILPAAAGIAEWLTPLAGSGLALVMVLAAITHLRRHEQRLVAVNAVLFVVAAVIAWGRFGPYPS